MAQYRLKKNNIQKLFLLIVIGVVSFVVLKNIADSCEKPKPKVSQTHRICETTDDNYSDIDAFWMTLNTSNLLLNNK